MEIEKRHTIPFVVIAVFVVANDCHVSGWDIVFTVREKQL